MQIEKSKTNDVQQSVAERKSVLHVAGSVEETEVPDHSNELLSDEQLSEWLQQSEMDAQEHLNQGCTKDELWELRKGSSHDLGSVDDDDDEWPFGSMLSSHDSAGSGGLKDLDKTEQTTVNLFDGIGNRVLQEKSTNGIISRSDVLGAALKLTNHKYNTRNRPL